MSTITEICGIDVSKDTLDISQASRYSTIIENRQVIPNKLAVIDAWLSEQGSQDILYVLEPTGNYSDKIIYSLHKNGLNYSLVPPFQSKSFMQSQGIVSKNDKQAADSLVKMGQSLDLKQHRIPSDSLQKRKQMLQAINTLKKEERRLLNQLHARDQLVLQEEYSRAALETVLQTIQQQLQNLEEQLSQQKQTEAYQQSKKYATSVIGIGETTADAILLATNCLVDFDDAGKVSKFLGVTPISHYSGSSIKKKGHITKFGSNHVRALLYNCTRSAVRYNPACRELFQRLRKNGKPYKVAAVAVMHKLIKQVFVCVKRETLFDKNYKHKMNKNTK